MLAGRHRESDLLHDVDYCTTVSGLQGCRVTWDFVSSRGEIPDALATAALQHLRDIT